MTDRPASHWLAHVPVPLFAVCMGVTGLGIAWRKAALLFDWPALIGDIACWAGAAFFVAIAALYALKVLRHADEVVAEFRHPVRANFFAAISVSLLLLSITLHDTLPGLALALMATGAALHLLLTLRLVTRWITQPMEITSINPAWFIPVVGNVVVPLAAVPLGHQEVAWFFFSVGLVFWMVLFSIVFYRIVFHDPIQARILPTLVILIAPPAVAFLAYEALVGPGLDPMARVLFHAALFLTLLNLALLPMFLRLPFAISWWAYTFPLDAMTIAALEYGHLTQSPFLQAVSLALLALSSLVVLVVLIGTFRALSAGRLFVPEPSPPPRTP